MSSPSWVRRGWACGSAILVVLGLLIAASTASAHGGRHSGLRDLAKRPLVGTAVDTTALANDADYRGAIAREFNSVTPENVMKWETVEPQQGVTDYTAADALLGFARANRQIVRGHTLVWHSQLPSWLTSGTFTNEQLEAILRRHIFEEAGHFRGRMYAWDVVNEAFNEDGTLRDTIWLRALGPDYIAKAFRWAHEADPHAKLYYNDYNLESIGPKSDAALALVGQLKAQGVPIDGVGFQGHLGIQYPYPDTFGENLERFAAAGVDVAITEADVRLILPVTPEKLATQATYFGNMMRSCVAVRRCVSFTLWGFTDRYSWVPGFFAGEGAATPFDESLRPKPAYFALRDALLRRGPRP
jgi:endo-1,4-beta-xylanase